MSKFKVRAAYGDVSKWVELDRGVESISTVKSLVAAKFGVHSADLSAYISGGRVSINSDGSFRELVDNTIKMGKKYVEVDVNYGSAPPASSGSSSSRSAERSTYSAPAPAPAPASYSSPASSSSSGGSPADAFKATYNDIIRRFNNLSDSQILNGDGEKIYKEFRAIFPELKTLYATYPDELRSIVDSFNDMNKKIPDRVNAVIRAANSS
eukprot:TRINITY_DN872_c0_g1_i1.p1 TRINITY_DN872_c0_g1~~TRINITY_DN872_c0_g1_i1.p1  ORF type:complete len:210 (+),score=50.11 TRINITY_DN872_c0_g1_i1:20-649(+)